MCFDTGVHARTLAVVCTWAETICNRTNTSLGNCRCLHVGCNECYFTGDCPIDTRTHETNERFACQSPRARLVTMFCTGNCVRNFISLFN